MLEDPAAQPCSVLRGVERPLADAGWGWAGWAGAALVVVGLPSLSPLVCVAAAGPLAARSVKTPSSWSHISRVEKTNLSICKTSGLIRESGLSRQHLAEPCMQYSQVTMALEVGSLRDGMLTSLGSAGPHR